jgi:hypothetical protein
MKTLLNGSDVELGTQNIHATFGQFLFQWPRTFLRLPINRLPRDLRQLENAFVRLATMQDGPRNLVKIALGLGVGSYFKFEPFVYELKLFLH